MAALAPVRRGRWGRRRARPRRQRGARGRRQPVRARSRSSPRRVSNPSAPSGGRRTFRRSPCFYVQRGRIARWKKKLTRGPKSAMDSVMQLAMDRLSGFVSRRRLLVLGVWIALLVVALPFAARQTEHLTAGGFGVPGSGSLAVQQAIEEFPGVQSESLVLVFDNPNRDAAQVRAAVDEAVGSIQGVANITVPPQALAAAKRGAGRPIVLLP